MAKAAGDRGNAAHGDAHNQHRRDQDPSAWVGGRQEQGQYGQCQIARAREAEQRPGAGDQQDGHADQPLRAVPGIQRQAGRHRDQRDAKQGHRVLGGVDHYRRCPRQVEGVMTGRLEHHEGVGDRHRRAGEGQSPEHQQGAAPVRGRGADDHEEGDGLDQVGAVQAERLHRLRRHQDRDRARHQEEHRGDGERAFPFDPCPLPPGLDGEHDAREQDGDLEHGGGIEPEVKPLDVSRRQRTGNSDQDETEPVRTNGDLIGPRRR